MYIILLVFFLVSGISSAPGFFAGYGCGKYEEKDPFIYLPAERCIDSKEAFGAYLKYNFTDSTKSEIQALICNDANCQKCKVNATQKMDECGTVFFDRFAVKYSYSKEVVLPEDCHFFYTFAGDECEAAYKIMSVFISRQLPCGYCAEADVERYWCEGEDLMFQCGNGCVKEGGVKDEFCFRGRSVREFNTCKVFF